jgi:DNA-binding transcriptional MocR family regulator
VPKDSPTADPFRKIDVSTALQYGRAQGYPPLNYFLRRFTRENLHPNVPYKGGPEIILTCGNTDGFAKTLELLNNTWADGDAIDCKEGLLCEQYAYPNAIAAARPRGMNIVPVGMDDEGMRAGGMGGLEDVLKNWDYTRGKRPHLMYTVTIGQNPTGATLGVKRRKAIYALCVKYDVIIIEDDPYWYLQYPSSTKLPRATPTSTAQSTPTNHPFLDSLIPSYLSVDYQGRVIRLDTFSKTIAPGCRLGWITAQPNLIERILRITETSTQQPSGFVQAMVAELIMGPAKSSGGEGRGGARDGSGWEVEGWVRWLEGLRTQYERRMNTMCDVLEAGRDAVKLGRRGSLSALALDDDTKRSGPREAEDDWSVVETTRMYEFQRPLGGMFVWLRFDFSKHPLSPTASATSSNTVPLPRLAKALWVFWTTRPYLVLAAPGAMFAPTPEVAARDAWQCFRLCFAAAPEAEVAVITKRLVKGATAFWRIKSKEMVDEILRDEDEGSESWDKLGADGLVSLMGAC